MMAAPRSASTAALRKGRHPAIRQSGAAHRRSVPVLVLALLLLAVPVAWAQPLRPSTTILLDSARIIVNNKMLTQREVASLQGLQEQELRRRLEGPALQERLQDLEQSIINQLVEDLLLESHAETLNITVTDDEIEERVDSIVRRDPKVSDIYDERQIKDFVFKDLLRRRVVQREVNAHVRVSDEEVLAACQEDARDNREIRVGHILVRGQDADALARSEALRQRLSAGEAFEQLASAESQDPSASSNGGVLGFIGRGQFLKPFEDAAFELPVGGVSQPVLTDLGYHIIKVFEERQKSGVDCANLDTATRQRYFNGLFARKNGTRLNEFIARLKDQSEICVKGLDGTRQPTGQFACTVGSRVGESFGEVPIAPVRNRQAMEELAAPQRE